MTEQGISMKVARIEGQLDMILAALNDAKAGRQRVYERLEEVNFTVSSLDSRTRHLEDGFAKNAPTIEEFVKIKQRVAGAGVAGKVIWAAGALILGAAYTIREHILAWLTKT